MPQSREDKIEFHRQLTRLIDEREYRKKINPLNWHRLLPLQQRFCDDKSKIRCLFGGNRCLGGETKIYDPVIDKYRRVDKIDGDHYVFAWDGSRQVIARAGKPFKKDLGHLYEVILSNGESFVCSDTHLVLGHDGYRPIGALTVGDVLFRPESILDISQSIHALDGQHYGGKFVSFQDGCHFLYHFYDGLLRSLLNICQVVFPSQADVQGRISSVVYARQDDLGYKQECSQTYRQFFHHSIQDGLDQIEGRFFDTLSHIFYKPCKLALHHIQVGFRSMIEFLHHLSIDGFFRLGSYLFFLASIISDKRLVVISSITYLRDDVKWDFEVPVYHNYVCGGVVHHNSGKSEGVAHYVIRRAVNNPGLRIWVAGQTYQDSVAIQQRKIWMLAPKLRIRYGQYNEIGGFVNRKLLFDNKSLITFKSYDQDVQSFASDDIDFIWLDEEPPKAIYDECRMRLIDRSGEMLISMTSTQGLTDLVDEIFTDCDIVETRHGELVNEPVPVIANKGGISLYFLSTLDNPHIIRDEAVRATATMSRDEIKARIYGVPINLTGRIYPTFNRQIHVIRWDDLPSGKWALYNIIDPHDRKPWAIGWFAVHQTGSAYMVDEWPERDFLDITNDDNTYDDYAKIIKAREQDLTKLLEPTCIKRIIDPNFGNKTIQLAERQGGQSRTTPRKELVARGLSYRDGIDALEAGHLAVKEWLHWASKDNEITKQPKIFFVETCRNTITGMQRYSRRDPETVDGDIKNKVGPMEKYKDFPDLVRYFIMSDPKYIYPSKPQELRKVY